MAIIGPEGDSAFLGAVPNDNVACQVITTDKLNSCYDSRLATIIWAGDDIQSRPQVQRRIDVRHEVLEMETGEHCLV